MEHPTSKISCSYSIFSHTLHKRSLIVLFKKNLKVRYNNYDREPISNLIIFHDRSLIMAVMFGYFVAIIAIFFLMTCCRAFSSKNNFHIYGGRT